MNDTNNSALHQHQHLNPYHHEDNEEPLVSSTSNETASPSTTVAVVVTSPTSSSNSSTRSSCNNNNTTAPATSTTSPARTCVTSSTGNNSNDSLVIVSTNNNSPQEAEQECHRKENTNDSRLLTDEPSCSKIRSCNNNKNNNEQSRDSPSKSDGRATSMPSIGGSKSSNNFTVSLEKSQKEEKEKGGEMVALRKATSEMAAVASTSSSSAIANEGNATNSGKIDEGGGRAGDDGGGGGANKKINSQDESQKEERKVEPLKINLIRHEAVIPKITIKPIIKPTESGSSQNSESGGNTEANNTRNSPIPKLTIKSLAVNSGTSAAANSDSIPNSPHIVPKLTIRANDSGDASTSSSSVSLHTVVPKLTIKMDTGGINCINNEKSHYIELSSSSSAASSCSSPSPPSSNINQLQPPLPKLTIKTTIDGNSEATISNISSSPSQCNFVGSSTLSPSISNCSSSSSSAVVPKITIKSIPKPVAEPLVVPEVTEEEAKVPKLTIKTSQEHAVIIQHQSIPKMTIKTKSLEIHESEPVEKIPKITIKTTSNSKIKTIPENNCFSSSASSSSASIPKLTISTNETSTTCTVVEQASERMPKLMFLRQEDHSSVVEDSEKVPKQEKIPKLTIKSISSSMLTSATTIDSEKQLSEKQVIPKLTIKTNANTSSIVNVDEGGGGGQEKIPKFTIRATDTSGDNMKLTVVSDSLPPADLLNDTNINTSGEEEPKTVPKLTIKNLSSPKLKIKAIPAAATLAAADEVPVTIATADEERQKANEVSEENNSSLASVVLEKKVAREMMMNQAIDVDEDDDDDDEYELVECGALPDMILENHAHSEVLRDNISSVAAAALTTGLSSSSSTASVETTGFDSERKNSSDMDIDKTLNHDPQTFSNDASLKFSQSIPVIANIQSFDTVDLTSSPSPGASPLHNFDELTTKNINNHGTVNLLMERLQRMDEIIKKQQALNAATMAPVLQANANPSSLPNGQHQQNNVCSSEPVVESIEILDSPEESQSSMNDENVQMGALVTKPVTMTIDPRITPPTIANIMKHQLTPKENNRIVVNNHQINHTTKIHHNSLNNNKEEQLKLQVRIKNNLKRHVSSYNDEVYSPDGHKMPKLHSYVEIKNQNQPLPNLNHIDLPVNNHVLVPKKLTADPLAIPLETDSKAKNLEDIVENNCTVPEVPVAPPDKRKRGRPKKSDKLSSTPSTTPLVSPPKNIAGNVTVNSTTITTPKIQQQPVLNETISKTLDEAVKAKRVLLLKKRLAIDFVGSESIDDSSLSDNKRSQRTPLRNSRRSGTPVLGKTNSSSSIETNSFNERVQPTVKLCKRPSLSLSSSQSSQDQTAVNHNSASAYPVGTSSSSSSISSASASVSLSMSNQITESAENKRMPDQEDDLMNIDEQPKTPPPTQSFVFPDELFMTPKTEDRRRTDSFDGSSEEMTPTRGGRGRGRGRGRGSRGGGRGMGRGRGRGRGTSRPRCIGGLKHTPDPERLKGVNFLSPERRRYIEACANRTPSEVQIYEEDTLMGSEFETPRPIEYLNNDDTQSSMISNTSILDTTAIVRKVKRKKFETVATENAEYTVDLIAEYDWPPPKGCCPAKNRDTFMIQEQIALFLGIKSFKRKYPDLPRRQVDMEERNWLQEKGLVAEKMCDLGITAVWASDILDIMYTDFYEKYEEYKNFVRQKHIRELEAKAKIGTNSNVSFRGMATRDRALHATSKWNAHFNKSRKEERRSCLDLQTLVVNLPLPAKFVNRPAPVTVKPMEPSFSYAMALVPGQFCENYRHYTPHELRSYPINTVLDPTSWKSRLSSPLKAETPDASSDVETAAPPEDGDTSDLSSSSCSSGSSSNDSDSDSSSDEEKPPDGLKCSVCHLPQNKNQKGLPEVFIRCFTCRRRTHPSCIEMPNRMVARVRNYNWQCADCKCCIKCKRKQDPAKMLFCEQCERGYHIYCLGVKSVPEGRWHCERCRVCIRCGSNKPEGNAPPPPPPPLLSPIDSSAANAPKTNKPKKCKWVNEYRIDPVTKLREHSSMLCVLCAKQKANSRRTNNNTPSITNNNNNTIISTTMSATPQAAGGGGSSTNNNQQMSPPPPPPPIAPIITPAPQSLNTVLSPPSAIPQKPKSSRKTTKTPTAAVSSVSSV